MLLIFSMWHNKPKLLTLQWQKNTHSVAFKLEMAEICNESSLSHLRWLNWFLQFVGCHRVNESTRITMMIRNAHHSTDLSQSGNVVINFIGTPIFCVFYFIIVFFCSCDDVYDCSMLWCHYQMTGILKIRMSDECRQSFDGVLWHFVCTSCVSLSWWIFYVSWLHSIKFDGLRFLPGSRICCN